MGVIFDLDQTIVDSKIAEPFRGKNWDTVYSLIPKFTKYSGIEEVFEFLQYHAISIAIVSSSPKTYCNKVLKHWNVRYDYVVGYHDTKRRKPHPDPIIRAIELMSLTSSEVISFGDRVVDIQASKAANILCAACFWGSSEDLLSCKPDFVAHKPIDLIPIISRLMNNK